jgi:long-chain acyl-CoA synthetase
LLEKVYDRIVAKGHEQTGIKRTLFFWALNLGLKYEHYGRNGWWYELQLKIANRLIFSKWREALGGRLMVVASGSAPLQPRLARVFWAAGIPVLEGYGLTETSPVVSVNTLLPNSARFGTVGKLIDGVSVRIAEDGEILCKGPNVMMGYYKRPDLTESVMTDGWFHTGDIGEVDSDGFLKITDRKKEIFKTSGGKYVAPQPLENKMKESPFIEQIMVVGDGRKFPGALIVPAFAYCSSYLAGKGIDLAKPEEIAAHPEIRKAIEEEVKRINQNFGQTEQIKKFALLSREFSIAADEMTPTLKFKRKNIVAKYAADIEAIYAGS